MLAKIAAWEQRRARYAQKRAESQGARDTLARVQARLAAVGRTAFSNYLLQTVICVSLFSGLGLYGQVERWGQILIVIAVLALQLALAPAWLARYRMGPMEWLWRSLTYWSRQPLRR